LVAKSGETESVFEVSANWALPTLSVWKLPPPSVLRMTPLPPAPDQSANAVWSEPKVGETTIWLSQLKFVPCGATFDQTVLQVLPPSVERRVAAVG